MEIRNIYKNGLGIFLALYLSGCAGNNYKEMPNFKLPDKDEIFAAYVKKKGGYAIRRPEDGDCIWNDMNVERLKNSKIDLLMIWEEQNCILPPKNLKPYESYALKKRDYYIINNGIVDGMINENSDVCYDEYPYASVLLLDNNDLIYFVDTDRDGLFDYTLPVKKDEGELKMQLPEMLPEPIEIECYKKTLI